MSSVGSMEKMFQTYKDVAEFRMIYIREAHALDGQRPNRLSKSLGIKEHTNLDERCSTAKRLIEDNSLSMPMLIDGMNNAANVDYSAHPDRVFLVRTDGTLAVAADRGPFGFSPGLKEVESWLAKYKKTGEEPALSDEAIFSGEAATFNAEKTQAKDLANKLSAIAGTWTMETEELGKTEVVITAGEAPLIAMKFPSENISEVQPADIRFDGKLLSFHFPTDTHVIRFDGEVKEGAISGSVKSNADTKSATWKRN